MPIDYSKYPANWLTEIRPRILERDGHKCKYCGVRNYSIIKRYKTSIPYKNWRYISTVEYDMIKSKVRNCGHSWTSAIKALGFTKIVLTIAHYDQNIDNNEDENLGSLCQRCHLIKDKKYRVFNKDKKIGQLTLAL
jgi:5-methylcytosine-specific restriction endonuclease McrA